MEVIDRIRTTKGVDHITATLRDEDKPVKVPIPAQRKRWETLQATLDGLPWLRLDLRNKAGDIVGVINAADDVIDDVGGQGLEALVPFARMMTETIRHTQSSHAAEMRDLLQGFQTLSSHLMQLLTRVTGLADDAYAMVRTLGRAPAADGEDAKADAAQFAQLMQLLQLAQAQAAAKAAAGVSGNRTSGPTHPGGVNGKKA